MRQLTCIRPNLLEWWDVPARHLQDDGDSIGITLRVGRVHARAELPRRLDHVRAGHFHPERVLMLRAAFEDAHEAIKDLERKALEIALLGERFTAQEAKDNDILNWIVPREKLAAETEAMARKLADGPTFALGVAKRLLRTSFDNSWDEHSHREAEGLAACAATEDHAEGLAAFLEKRKASFKGR
jgi:enoyl-CoA hydratase/carnithine racemase